jgi:signal transduction histidine kinase
MTDQTSLGRTSRTWAALHPHRFAWWSLPPVLLVIVGSIGASHEESDSPLLLVGGLAGLAGLAALTALIGPRTSVLANGAAVGAYFGLGLTSGPIFISVPLVAFLASQRARPRPLLSALVPALALILAGLAARSWIHDASGAVTFWQGSGLSALSLGACVLGWWLTDRRAGRQEQAQRTAAEERLRMAQDLHDGVGHGLAVISMHAAVALHVLDKVAGPKGHGGDGVDPAVNAAVDPALSPAPGGAEGSWETQLRQSLEVIRDTGRESLDALRVQLAAISTGPGASGSRRPAPGLPELEDLLARVRTGGLTVVRRGDAGEVPEEVSQAVYAVVQESLTNVLRHARAARASVTLTRAGPELVVSIQDDGPGSGAARPGEESPDAAGPGHDGAGMGIPGMRSRVERLGGTLESGLTDEGFVVRVRLPTPT